MGAFWIVQCESPLDQFPRGQDGAVSVQVPRPLRISEVHGSGFHGDKGDEGHGGRRAAYLEEVVMETQVGLQGACAWSTACPALVSEGAGVDPEPQAASACLVSLLGGNTWCQGLALDASPSPVLVHCQVQSVTRDPSVRVLVLCCSESKVLARDCGCSVSWREAADVAGLMWGPR